MSESRPPDTTRPMPVVDTEKHLPQPVEPAAPPPSAKSSGRFWSARRVPSAIVALLLLGGAGLLLYDIVAVRTGQPAMYWRRELARQLAEHPLDYIPVLAGAAFVTAVGLWLILLALTPGLRQLLPMLRPRPDVRAALTRDAAAQVLRDRAVEVSGVQEARVRMGRRRADVRVISHFRDPAEVRTDLDAALAGAVTDLGLARRPKVSVRLRGPGKKG
ncbi:DUF6286 domain-containing protein [Streptomyces sp. NBC_00566]|uniref:DUF6286 domain-containing protein n=1 Tax=Streptomyces sp. NBC_00566 TaxID=2975778 RepID=UPI002E80DEE3|nr:DUF6286 domain-containing protein [Streptomyces sp. NBC_00566]WUB89395.1 DUF6286 domain-containing protein [Streptomyces sp. NBC_00566]